MSTVKPPHVKARRAFNKGNRRGRGLAAFGTVLFGGAAGTLWGMFDGTREIISELFPDEDEEEAGEEEEEEEDEAGPVLLPAAR